MLLSLISDQSSEISMNTARVLHSFMIALMSVVTDYPCCNKNKTFIPFSLFLLHSFFVLPLSLTLFLFISYPFFLLSF